MACVSFGRHNPALDIRCKQGNAEPPECKRRKSDQCSGPVFDNDISRFHNNPGLKRITSTETLLGNLRKTKVCELKTS